MKLYKGKNVMKKFLIILVILSGILLPVIFLNIHIQENDRKILSCEFMSKNKQMANIVANQINQLLKSTFSLLEATAKYPSIEKKEIKSLEPLMKTLVQKYRFFTGLYLLDSNGQIILNITGAPDVFSSHPTADFYTNIIKGKLSNYVSRNVFLSKSSMRPSLTMGVIIRGDLYRLKAILAAQVDLTYLISQLKEYKLGTGTEIFVADDQGKVVTHPGYDVLGGTESFLRLSSDLSVKMSNKKEGSFLFKENNKNYFISFVKMRKYNEFREQMPEWTVVVKQPVNDFMNAVNWLANKKKNLIISLLITGFGLSLLVIKLSGKDGLK